MSKQINLRISKWTEEQLENLDEWTGYTQTQIILLAVDHLWKEVKQERTGKKMENIDRISNDDLYKQYPSLHEQASETMCNEQNYPAVDAWLVEKDSQGDVTGVYEPIFADWYKQGSSK